MYIATPKEMSELDNYAITRLGIPGIVLMENAALAVVNKAIEMLKDVEEKFVVVFAGTGNNGGDGYAVARMLEAKDIKTVTYIFGDILKIKGDAKINYDINCNLGLDSKMFSPAMEDECIEIIKRSDLTIDALLGTGFSGNLRNEMDKGIDLINRYSRRILSVDIPSGVNGYDGSIGECAVNSDETVTFCLPKVGLCVYPGKAHAGNITVADIQIPKFAVEEMKLSAQLIDADAASGMLPARKPDGNKGDYGRVAIFAGSKGMIGAQSLAAKAAYRTGSGLVYILSDVYDETEVLEAVKIDIGTKDNVSMRLQELKDFLEKQDCFVIGPGMGNSERTLDIVRFILSLKGKNVVLDADGLNVISGNIDILENSDCNIAITPHPGEMSRLCGKSIEEIQCNRISTARSFATKTGVTVVLKGADTVIADPTGRIWINQSGCSGMSTAGSGDVLTGMIGSFIGQGLNILKACTLGVYLHGLAGEYSEQKFTVYGMTASDIICMIPTAFKTVGKLYNSL